MAEDSQKQALVVHKKKGVPVYLENPSLPHPDSIKKKRLVKLGSDKKGFVIDGTGEVLGPGVGAFYEFEEVDDSRFVKLFLDGFKQTVGMGKAGLTVFELVYRQVQEKPNSDKVELSFYVAAQKIEGLTERTYHRGLRELLDREFLFRSPVDGVFFVNIRYIFNGDRLAFVKGYSRKKGAAVLDVKAVE